MIVAFKVVELRLYCCWTCYYEFDGELLDGELLDDELLEDEIEPG